MSKTFPCRLSPQLAGVPVLAAAALARRPPRRGPGAALAEPQRQLRAAALHPAGPGLSRAAQGLLATEDLR